MSRITLRVRLLRSSHWPISSLGRRPPTYFDSLTFSLSVGVRKIMIHFVVQKITHLLRDLRHFGKDARIDQRFGF